MLVLSSCVCFIRSIHSSQSRQEESKSQRDETQGGKREEKEKDAKADATRWYVRKIIIIERERESLCCDFKMGFKNPIIRTRRTTTKHKNAPGDGVKFHKLRASPTFGPCSAISSSSSSSSSFRWALFSTQKTQRRFDAFEPKRTALLSFIGKRVRTMTMKISKKYIYE